MTGRVLVVWWADELVGRLVQGDGDDLSFIYDPAWLAGPDARPVSRSLPLSIEPYDRRRCRPFFAGLLPVGEQRAVAARVLGVSPDNDFALLERLGADVPGALTLSSAGVAPSLTAPGETITPIVGAEDPRFPGAVANEAWCMALAGRIGLGVAPAQAGEVAGEETGRVHREDACQALGVPPERRYAIEGGPDFRRLFDLTRAYVVAPARDLLRLVDVALFNLAIGNTEAHGGMFAFLLDGSGGVRLAPFRGLRATIAWPACPVRFAMPIGPAGTIAEFDAAAWALFAADAGITLPFLRRRGTTLMDAIARDATSSRGDDGLRWRTAARAVAIGQTLAR